MENPRPEKVAQVKEVKELIDSSSTVVVTEYRGLSVHSLSQLRRDLREAGGYYKVYKNTLVRRAVEDTDAADLKQYLLGPTALAFVDKKPDGTDGDVVTVAKTLRDFGKGHPELIIKGGLFDGEPIDENGINQLADVEPREVLLAKFAGLLQAPMSKFAGLMQALPRDFAYGLQALIDKGGASDAPSGDNDSAEKKIDDSAKDDSEKVEENEDSKEESQDEKE